MGKILISGTGRCGTSFLVHIISALKMDTGYTEDQCEMELMNECNGGCEYTIEKPYHILKNPEFAVDMHYILQDYEIDHVIIPIRGLIQTAESRAKNNSNHGGYGGFWLGANSVEEQANAHARLIYALIDTLTRNDTPFTMLSFPRIVEDKSYLKMKLHSIFHSMTDYKNINDNFDTVFDRVSDTNKITVR